jgi:hypothetical protein
MKARLTPTGSAERMDEPPVIIDNRATGDLRSATAGLTIGWFGDGSRWQTPAAAELIARPSRRAA